VHPIQLTVHANEARRATRTVSQVPDFADDAEERRDG
jgi:hypothetical protein